MSATRNDSRGGRWVRYVVGVLVGGVVGAVVAVNVVIYSGIDRGYEASLAEVLGQSPLVGVLVIAILLAGPVLGVVLARRLGRHR